MKTSINTKLILGMMVIVLISSIITGVCVSQLYKGRVHSQMDEELSRRMLFVKQHLFRNAELLAKDLEVGAAGVINGAVGAGGGQRIEQELARYYAQYPQYELWMVTDEDGRVVHRLDSAISGDRLGFSDAIERAVSNGRPIYNILLLSKSDMLNPLPVLLRE